MEQKKRGRPKLHAEITEAWAPSRRQALNAMYLFEAAHRLSVAATEIPNHELLWYSDPAARAAGGKHGIMEQLGRMLMQDKLSEKDCIAVANMAISALQAGKTSREIENAIRKIRMAIKKYEAAPEDERDYNSIRVAVGELEKLGCAV